jgi:SAM-dependent methyltransferase
MRPEALDLNRRAGLRELLDEPCERELLRAYLRDIARTNRLTLAYRPTLHWLRTLAPALRRRGGPVRILDVGCGYGDGLRRVEKWARSRGIDAELAGIDLNPDAVSIAAEAGHASSRIQWIAADVFAYTPAQPPDIILSSLFTHHLADAEIIRFLAWMEANSRLGWFINDLSRASIPYHFFRMFSRLAGLHPYVQNDGPISILRSFVREDWQRMCAQAGLDGSAIEILPFKPARLCVSRRKPQ